jgi:uncharacterized alpha-E superfamily protein
LRACSGQDAFMKASHGRVTAQEMVEFLLFSPSFPRSLRYCLRSAYGLLRRIWSEDPRDDPAQHASLNRLGALLDWLDTLEHGLDLGQIHSVLTHVVDETALICNAVGAEIQGPARPSDSRVPPPAEQPA